MLLAAKWPGEGGISVSRHRFTGGARVSIERADHLIFMQPHALAKVTCSVGNKRLDHSAAPWNITIVPSGAASRAETAADVETIVLAIPPQLLAVALAEETRPRTHLVVRLDGRDERLAALGRGFVREAIAGFPEGALGWSELTDAFIGRLIDRHTSSSEPKRPGALDERTLRMIREYVCENIDGPLMVGDLAHIAGQDYRHFARYFLRSTGVTPHYYIMRVRLTHALQLLSLTRLGLAEAAAQSGFSDQSHLARWGQRVYGASLTQLVRRKNRSRFT